jgi:hypothetical protein
MTRQDAYRLIDAERVRQAEKWSREHTWGYGDCSGNIPEPVKTAVLTEECGEVARAVLDRSPVDQLRAELVQVAAVAVAWLESLPAE